MNLLVKSIQTSILTAITTKFMNTHSNVFLFLGLISVYI